MNKFSSSIELGVIAFGKLLGIEQSFDVGDNSEALITNAIGTFGHRGGGVHTEGFVFKFSGIKITYIAVQRAVTAESAFSYNESVGHSHDCHGCDFSHADGIDVSECHDRHIFKSTPMITPVVPL